MNKWTEQEIKYLEENYSKYSNDIIFKFLYRHPKSSIMDKACCLNLKKDEKWTEYDINYLIKNYHNVLAIDIVKILNRSYSSIIHKANRLNLKKDIRHEIHPKNMTDEQLYNIAIQYKRRSIFDSEESATSKESKKRGIYEEICSHMIDNSSAPQKILQKITETIFNIKGLYNTYKIIYPYQLDIYFEEFNLAFEYDGLYYHEDKQERDDLKNELCKIKKINLIRIYEFKDRNNFEKYEEDIKNQLIENLNLINNITKLNIKKEDILSVEINKNELLLDLNDIKKICDSYTILNVFRIEQKKLYIYLKRTKLLNEFTSHMIRNGKIWSVDELKEEISKFTKLKDLRKTNIIIYNYCIKHYSYLLENLEKSIKFWTEQEIKYLKDNYNILNVKEISKKLNRSISSIVSFKYKNKLN